MFVIKLQVYSGLIEPDPFRSVFKFGGGGRCQFWRLPNHPQNSCQRVIKRVDQQTFLPPRMVEIISEQRVLPNKVCHKTYENLVKANALIQIVHLATSKIN